MMERWTRLEWQLDCLSWAALGQNMIREEKLYKTIGEGFRDGVLHVCLRYTLLYSGITHVQSQI